MTEAHQHPVADDFVGVRTDLTNEQYHAGPGVSKSGLDLLRRSPFHYYSYKLDPNRPPEKKRAGQLEGTLAHSAILEPDTFAASYAVLPSDAPRRPTDRQRNAIDPSESSLASIAWWDEWNDKNGHKTTITADQWTCAWRQSEAVRQVAEIREILESGVAEESAYWRDEETGLLCRCRPDWRRGYDGGDVLLDVKTYSSADPHEFVRQAARKRYYVQDRFYSDGYAQASGREVLEFIFVAVETEYPYAACPVILDEESRNLAREEYRADLRRLAACVERDEWPSYSDAIQIVTLPNWKLRQGFDS